MSEETQVSNDSIEQESPKSVEDDFFSSLEEGVNSIVFDKEETQSQETTQQLSNEVGPPGKSVAELENLQKRYGDSSREAKKLKGELTEIEPYMPILNAMREDPNLVSHVRNYFEGGGQAPNSVKESLGLGEDFLFDADDSAKVLSNVIDKVVSRRLNTALSGQKQENQKLATESDFRSRHEMRDGEWTDFVEFAKSKTLDLDDILYLKNRSERERNIAKSAGEQVSQQMRKTQAVPRSLATAGSEEVETSPDDQVFEAILGIDKELESAFG
jgi:hypothetical protein